MRIFCTLLSIVLVVVACNDSDKRTYYFHEPVVLDSSYSGYTITTTDPVVEAANGAGLVIRNAHDISIRNLHIRGNGRKNGNTSNGIQIVNCTNVTIDSIDVEGFQKSGLAIEKSSGVWIMDVHAHDNGFAGISTSESNDILIYNSFAENNPGDPTNLTNHSGNGIIVGRGKRIAIANCRATNNGWDMPRVGNGPVGIWAYECDSVQIVSCVSYENKTSKGGEDGGGFDLDGGVTNSIIEHCVSFENEGAGFGLFQYEGATSWKNNIIRNNVSWNDGRVSPAHASIYVWNASNDPGKLSGCEITDNVFYNNKGAAVHFAAQSRHEKFLYQNNVFATKFFTTGDSTGSDLSHNVTITPRRYRKSRNCVICALK